MTEIIVNVFYAHFRERFLCALHVNVHDYAAEIEDDVFYVLHLLFIVDG
jgi:hypothetical protein